jgi:hypothetical protein
VKQVLGDSDRLQDIRKNGLRRMGPVGAADRIAAQLMAGFGRLV